MGEQKASFKIEYPQDDHRGLNVEYSLFKVLPLFKTLNLDNGNKMCAVLLNRRFRRRPSLHDLQMDSEGHYFDFYASNCAQYSQR